jgi:hypothetical protein
LFVLLFSFDILEFCPLPEKLPEVPEQGYMGTRRGTRSIETLPKVDAKVVEVLAVMAKYNPFFERAGMLRVDYTRDKLSIDSNIRKFLERCSFDFKLVESKAYCRSFFNKLTEEEKVVILGYLSEFAHQPFVKVTTVTPELLSRVFPSAGVYLYWVRT